MIYSDDELRRWWGLLSKMRINEIFETMIEKAWSEGAQKFAESLKEQWESGRQLSPKQLQSIRKWDR